MRKTTLILSSLAVLVASGIAGAAIYNYTQPSTTSAVNLKIDPNAIKTITTPPTNGTDSGFVPENGQTAGASDNEVVESYTGSKFRVISSVKHTKAPYYLVTATTRSPMCTDKSGQPSPCANDTACGSIYSQPTCFFFLEPAYDVNAHKTAHYVGKASKIGGVHESTKYTFTDADHVRFTAAEGDAGMGSETVYELNLNTGELKKLSETKIKIDPGV